MRSININVVGSGSQILARPGTQISMQYLGRYLFMSPHCRFAISNSDQAGGSSTYHSTSLMGSLVWQSYARILQIPLENISIALYSTLEAFEASNLELSMLKPSPIMKKARKLCTVSARRCCSPEEIQL